jgi:hypothetical protein
LAGLAKKPLIAAEAPRKHSTGSNRIVCRTHVGNELASDEVRKQERTALTGASEDEKQADLLRSTSGIHNLTEIVKMVKANPTCFAPYTK